MMSDMHSLLTTARAAAKDAGQEIMRLYETLDFETKIDGSPVTIADTRANEIILSHLEKTNIAILSEESEGVALPYPERMWIIDPLDGTRDFIKKTDDFVVMIGLVEHGKPVLGVMYAPAHNTEFFAHAGAGAYMVHEGETTKLELANTPSQALRFARSTGHFTPHMERVSDALDAIQMPRGSMGIKASLISMNAADFYFSYGHLGEWDVCAPEVIVTEAGGRVTDCDGNALHYGAHNHRIQNGTIFSNGACHARVHAAIHATREPETAPECP